MQYISPLHFVELPPTGAIDRKDLLLARKKMLAELELNEGRGLEINGKELFKNDIAGFFDELAESSALLYHQEIYRDKILLRFLEHGIFERKELFAMNPLYIDDDFVNWISPYYTDTFIHFSNECFRFLMDKEWDALLNNPLLMNGYHREIAWDNIGKNMEGDIERLNFIAQKKLVRDDLTELDRLCDFRRLKMLSMLPEERFYRIRDEMAFAMMQICIKMFNYINKKWALINIKNACQLSVSEELTDQIHNTLLEMELIFEKENRDFWNVNFFKWSTGRKIFVLSVGVLTIISTILSNRAGYKSPYDIHSAGQMRSLAYPLASPTDSIKPNKVQEPLNHTKKNSPK